MASLAELLQAQQDQAEMMQKLSNLPGINRAAAQAAQLQNQPMAPSGMLRPADQTAFGEMPQLSPQELAARGTATVPTSGFQNSNVAGANFGRTVPYYAAKELQAANWDISPEMINEYKKAGINKLVTERGGNTEVVVGHEGSHDVLPDEMQNRRFTYERYAGKPEGNLAKAQYQLARDQEMRQDDPYFANLRKAAFPAFGNPKYASVEKALKAYEATAPMPSTILDKNKKAR